MTNDQTVTQALEPCPNPWCSDSKPVVMQGGFRGRKTVVECVTCQMRGPIVDDIAGGQRAAITAWNTRTAHSGEGRSKGAGEDLEDHFPSGLRSGYARTAGGVPVQGGGVEIDCRCGWSAKASDEHEARQQWADHARAALSAPQGEVERLRAAALTDDPDWICAGIPDQAIEAGIEAWKAAESDIELRARCENPEDVTDWDEGMIVAAIFKAVARAALAQPEAGGEHE